MKLMHIVTFTGNRTRAYIETGVSWVETSLTDQAAGRLGRATCSMRASHTPSRYCVSGFRGVSFAKLTQAEHLVEDQKSPHTTL